eukprot:4243935-Alexandrium_andersonii.AAC.1
MFVSRCPGSHPGREVLYVADAPVASNHFSMGVRERESRRSFARLLIEIASPGLRPFRSWHPPR